MGAATGPSRASKLYRDLLVLASFPFVHRSFLARETGAQHGLTARDKLGLLRKMLRNQRSIPSASHLLEHVTLATYVLSLPRTRPGVVIECGTYKGASAANLSLACAIAGRRLEVFDSFRGLPELSTNEASHTLPAQSEIRAYAKGGFAGSLDEVRANIERFGDLSVCRFHPGYFEDTLPGFAEPAALVFLDVDLRSSEETCLRHLWPLLGDDCVLFTHDAAHAEVASLFFDRRWWDENLDCAPPGLVGAGSGIGLIPGPGAFWSNLGYTVKNPSPSRYRVVPEDR